MAIAAAAVLLLLAAVGGGIDMSRAYMAKTNLQSACDAGALAGRKAMAATGVYTDAEKAKANKMFDFNAKLASTDSDLVGEFETEADDEGAVNGSAAITMPTVIMKMFGIDTFDLSVQCSAELQMSSADIIFVLDTTGSMNCAPGDSCNTSYEHSGSKISALKDAVKEFHKTVAAAVIDKEQTRIRYAFVPYSMTVNVSGLLSSGAMPASYMASSTPYQTRLARFGPDPNYPVTSSTTLSTETESTSSFHRSSDCYSWTNANATTVSGGPPPTTMTVYEYSYKDWNKWSDECQRYKKKVRRQFSSTPYYKFNEWRYIKSNIPTSGFTSGSVQAVTDLDESNATAPSAGYFNMVALAQLSGTSGLDKENVSWSGCIEERNTVVDFDMDPVPDDAYDLDIISAPTSNETRWKPYIGAFVFDRGSSYPNYRDTTSDYSSEGENCPAPIRQFQEVDTTDPTTVPSWLNTYVNNLVARGSTYHDLGMIWAARLGSTRGIFADNVNEGDNPSVSRHIIFMTDGKMEPSTSAYSAYGIQRLDGRPAPTNTGSSDLADYHTNRFLAACREAEAEGYTVWLIAFGTTITSQMLECSTADRAYYASDATELNNTFKFIAGQVADLRINK